MHHATAVYKMLIFITLHVLHALLIAKMCA